MSLQLEDSKEKSNNNDFVRDLEQPKIKKLA